MTSIKYYPPESDKNRVLFSGKELKLFKNFLNQTVPFNEFEKAAIPIIGKEVLYLRWTLDNWVREQLIIMNHIICPKTNQVWISFRHKNESLSELDERHQRFLKETFGPKVKVKEPYSFLEERKNILNSLYNVTYKEVASNKDLPQKNILAKEIEEIEAELNLANVAFEAAKKERHRIIRKRAVARMRIKNLTTKEADNLFVNNAGHITPSALSL